MSNTNMNTKQNQMMDFSHEEIEDARTEALIEAQEQLEDELDECREEFGDYLRDNGADFSDGFNN